MFERAVEVAESGRVDEVWVRCSEADETNYGHLNEVVAGLKHDRVKIKAEKQTFDELARQYMGWAAEERASGRRLPPTFVMIDPFGVKGVHMETLRKLLEIDRVEVFLTLMVRDPARFLEGYDQALTALFGGEQWRACREASDRPECLMRAFDSVIRPAAAKYMLPFKVYEDQRNTLLYYLVHLTNHDRGMREMKRKMLTKSGEMTFYPITLRPPVRSSSTYLSKRRIRRSSDTFSRPTGGVNCGSLNS